MTCVESVFAASYGETPRTSRPSLCRLVLQRRAHAREGCRGYHPPRLCRLNHQNWMWYQEGCLVPPFHRRLDVIFSGVLGFATLAGLRCRSATRNDAAWVLRKWAEEMANFRS